MSYLLEDDKEFMTLKRTKSKSDAHTMVTKAKETNGDFHCKLGGFCRGSLGTELCS